MIRVPSACLLKGLRYTFSNLGKNYYQILQSSPTTSQQQLKKQYYTLVKKYHPDVSKLNQEHIKLINEAYSVLSDQTKRKKYDQEKGLIKKEKKYRREEPSRSEKPYEQSYTHRAYYNEEKQTFKSKLRTRPNNPFQSYLRDFMIGLLITGVLLIIFGASSKQPKRAINPPPPKKYGKQQFERDFQNSLMRRPSLQ